MSVVNQMLKDLQYRDAGARRSGARLVMGVAANDASKPDRDPRITAILVMSLAASGFLAAAAWEFLARPPTVASPATPLASTIEATPGELAVSVQAEPPTVAAAYESISLPPIQQWLEAKAGNEDAERQAMASASPATAAVPTTEAPVASSPFTLGIIRSGWSPGRTRFVFKFDRWPAAVELEPGDGSLISLRFADTAYADKPPLQPPADRLLANIEQRISSEASAFIFHARPDVRISASYHRMTQDGDWPHWIVLDLKPAKDPAPPAPALDSADPEPTQQPQSEPELPVTASTTAEPAAELSKQTVPPEPTELAQARLSRAHAALRETDGEQALALARQALALDPDLIAARELLAGLLLRAGDIEAESVLADGLRRHPGHPGLARLQARLLVDQAREAEALTVLDGARAAGAKDAEFLALLAATHQRLQQHEPAVENYMRAIDLVRGQGLWWLGLAISLEALEHRQDALAAYREAMDSNMLPPPVRQFAEQRMSEIDGR